MKNKKKVSVCIPCYNAEEYIRETIESVLNQTYGNFTLHIIDNNSTDNTLDIVKKIKDNRIKIHKNRKNIGMFPNMNKCIEVCSTSYIKIICADDLLHKECLANQVRILDKYPKVVLVYNASNIIDFQGKKILTRRFFNSDHLTDGSVLTKKILKSGRNPVGEPTVIMFRRDIAWKNKIFFENNFSLIGDLDMWIKILKFGDGYYINKEFNSFRIHGSSGSSKLLANILKEHVDFFNKHKDRANLNNIDKFFYISKVVFYMVVKNLIFKIYSRKD